MMELHLDSRRHAQDLRDTWQARVLAETRERLAAVMLAVLFHNFRPAMQILMRVVFPDAPLAKNGWTEIALPFLYGGATIMRNGAVACWVMTKEKSKVHALIYESEYDLNRDLRGLADRLAFTDLERREMAESVKRWIVRDLRIDHMGRRIAS